MSVKRVEPNEAAELTQQGWILVDVRSIPEFAQGHPQGAYNIPIMHRGPAGMTPNPRFLEVVKRHFSAGDKLVMSCRSGQRSMRAAQLLLGEGFADVVDMRGGWDGERQGTAVVCAGWQERGLPSATEAEPGRSYGELED